MKTGGNRESFRAQPPWVQVTAWACVAGFLLFGPAAACGDAGAHRVAPALETTTTSAPPTTRATVVATTTTAPPTTVAPTTAPPPPPTAPPPTPAPVVVTQPPPPPPPPPSCTPGYSPCIAPGPDVDCAGGSGDGPRYTGPVSVDPGSGDPYDLDRDGDGAGCESS